MGDFGSYVSCNISKVAEKGGDFTSDLVFFWVEVVLLDVDGLVFAIDVEITGGVSIDILTVDDKIEVLSGSSAFGDGTVVSWGDVTTESGCRVYTVCEKSSGVSEDICSKRLET